MVLSTLEKGLSLLSLFDHERKFLSASEISNELSISLSSTYKYIGVLRKSHFLKKKPETKDKYQLGLIIYKLGTIALSGIDLVDVAYPYMKSLAKLSGETVYLSVISNREVICLETVESEMHIKLSYKKGSTLPLHAGASSKILLGFSDEQFFSDFVTKNPLTKFSRNTITNIERLKKEIKVIRARGYATSEAETDEMASSAAAPIYNHEGDVVAAISIAGPTQRMKGKISGFIDLVKKTAEQISHDLGYEYGSG